MKRQLSHILIAILAFSCAGGLAQDQTPQQIRLAPDEIALPPPAAAGQPGTAGIPGTQLKIVSGDPKKPGLYTMLVKLPPHTTIRPHAHPDDRVGIVVSGTWYFAFGNEYDAAKLKALPPGSFYTEPPGANHFAATRDEAVTIYITGNGPTGTTYVNSADDPFKKP